MKCKLISVQGAKEVIAEGRVASTDPKSLVHFVPLGENAVKVWVDVIKVPNAPLWRPTSYFEFIEDALGSTIAWPSTNIITESTSSKYELSFFSCDIIYYAYHILRIMN